METYIGTKIINATPMTRLAYNQLRGWPLPADENGEDAGFLVEYTDGGKPNLEGYAGYVSWSPAEQFAGAYRETNGLTFGLAIEALKKGHKVARVGWNGKGMWLVLVDGANWGIGGHAPYDIPGGEHITHAPFIGMRTADCKFVPWLASQTDVLAEDWQVL
ncbi:DUF2829 domain-containing protein [uncultured Rhodoferax sp.]|uniref:DUF2829 domain-containing protein n=1 Tax=uncultured Rhodoferax sp. TaxID=223188 RepID=UPI0025E13A6B|nr:DUF2829 domain-containing protein [uncultured Rhodoferax sp.]